MSPGRETSRTQSCLEHLRPGSERPLRLIRARRPSAIAPIAQAGADDDFFSALGGIRTPNVPPWPALWRRLNTSWHTWTDPGTRWIRGARARLRRAGLPAHHRRQLLAHPLGGGGAAPGHHRPHPGRRRCQGNRPGRAPGPRQRHRDEQVRYCRRYVLPVIVPIPVGASAAPISSGSWTKRPPPRWPSTCGAASAAWSPPGSTRDTSYPARTCSGGCAGAPPTAARSPMRSRSVGA